MLSDLKYKIGDVMVRYGKVVKTFEIKGGTIFLKPYFGKSSDNGGLVYSVPIKNIKLTKTRRAVSQEKLKSLFEKVLKKKLKKKEIVNLNTNETRVLSESNDSKSLPWPLYS